MIVKPPIYLVAQRKLGTLMNGWIPPFGILRVGKALQAADQEGSRHASAL